MRRGSSRVVVGCAFSWTLCACCATACSGPHPDRATSPGRSVAPSAGSRAAAPTCVPKSTTPDARWPRAVPTDLPRLPSAGSQVVERTPDGLLIVRFTTIGSLRDGILFILASFPNAGYTLARGDEEPGQADQPFLKDGVSGVLRGVSVSACATEWLLAISKTKQVHVGTPLLPWPATSPSPLPFS